MRRGLGFHNRRSPGVFNPLSLFQGGIVQGAWYDPSDITTLFQDSAGTTPVTAVEQPVGLMLDKSKGLVLGSQLIGNFLSASYWNLYVIGPVFSGSSIDFDAVDDRCAATSPMVSGRSYRCVITCTATGGGFIRVDDDGIGAGLGSNTTYLDNISSTTTFVIRSTASTRLRLIQSSGSGTISVTGFSLRELPGNHAYQTTSASRPTLRARYNLLTRSEEFDNAAWIKTNATVTPNAGMAPDGTTTADLLYPASTGFYRGMYQQPTLAAALYIDSFYVKASGKTWVQVLGLNGAGLTGVWFNLANGTVGTQKAGYTGTIQSVGSGWYRVAVTHPSQSNPYVTINVVDGDNIESVTANGTDGVLLWGAQLIQNAVFPSNTYQRVGASTDYATGAAFPPYLFCDGIDDGLLTNSVDFSATDKMTVWAGVTKNSDALAGVIVELGTDYTSPGGWYLVNDSSPPRYEYAGRGARAGVANDAATAPIAGPNTSVLTSQQNLNNNTPATIRRNGALAGSSVNTTFGGGNFGNYPLYIGRRNNATIPFNGNIYSLVIAGQSYAAGQVTSTEQWVAARTPLGSI